jgi:hypothetical protein
MKREVKAPNGATIKAPELTPEQGGMSLEQLMAGGEDD